MTTINPIRPGISRCAISRISSPLGRKGPAKWEGGHVAFFAIAALAVALLAGVQARAANPETETEKLVGKAMTEAFKDQYGVVGDPTVNAWVDRIGNQVAAQCPRRDLDYHFVIGDTDINNAFSVPGGTIFVTKGLLDAVTDDDELAGVLGHELGHQYHDDAAKLFAAEAGFGVLDGDIIKPSTEVTQTAAVLVGGLGILALSRSDEAHADESGVDFSSKADYDPRGLVSFFHQIEGPGKQRENSLAELFDTHPATPDRIKHVTDRIDANLTDADWKRIADRTRAEYLYGRAATLYTMAHDPADAAAARAAVLALPGPPVAMPPPPTFQPDAYAAFTKSLNASRHRLNRAFSIDDVNTTLQQVLAVSVTNRDFGMFLLAAQAYATEARAQGIAAREATVTRTGPSLWMAMAAPGAQPEGSQDHNAAEAAAADLTEAAETIDNAVPPLQSAEETLSAAILDLDVSAFGIGFKQDRTAHYGAVEAALLIAYASLDRAQHEADIAHRNLDRAHLRLLDAQLDAYPTSDVYTAIAARWLNVTPDRLSAIMTANGQGYGSTATLICLAAEMRKDPSAVSPPKIAGASNVDLADQNGASLGALTLILRMIERDFEAARTITPTTTGNAS